MKKVLAVLGLLAFAGLAYAASEKVEREGGQFPIFFNKGIYVGPDSPNPANDVNNKVGRMLGASVTIDFASSTITCRDSTAISVLGAQVNDPCFVGMPATLTAGGTGLHESFTCYVSAADNVKIRACPAGTADDPGNVTYKVRVISNNL